MLNWICDDGVYCSDDKRFTIMRATENYHSGQRWMRDNKTDMEEFRDTLRDCKYVAETYWNK